MLSRWMQNLALRVGAVPVGPPSQPSSDDNGGHHSTFLSFGEQQGCEILSGVVGVSG